MTEAEWRHEAREIAVELSTLASRLAGLGLFKTMQALDGATKAIGYEIADKLEQPA